MAPTEKDQAADQAADAPEKDTAADTAADGAADNAPETTSDSKAAPEKAAGDENGPTQDASGNKPSEDGANPASTDAKPDGAGDQAAAAVEGEAGAGGERDGDEAGTPGGAGNEAGGEPAPADEPGTVDTGADDTVDMTASEPTLLDTCCAIMQAVLRMNMSDTKMARDLDALADVLASMEPVYASVVARPILERLAVYLDRVLRTQQEYASVTYRTTLSSEAADKSKGSFRSNASLQASAGCFGLQASAAGAAGLRAHTGYGKGSLSEMRATARPMTSSSQSADQPRRMADLTSSSASHSISGKSVPTPSRCLVRLNGIAPDLRRTLNELRQRSASIAAAGPVAGMIGDDTARRMWVAAFGGGAESVTGTEFVAGMQAQLAQELRQPDPRFVSTLLLACIQLQAAGPDGASDDSGAVVSSGGGGGGEVVEDCMQLDKEASKQEAARVSARMVTRNATASFAEVAAAQQAMYEAEDEREDAKGARDAALAEAAEKSIITVQAFDAITQQGGPQWCQCGEVQKGQVIRHRRDQAVAASEKAAEEAEDRRAAAIRAKADLAEANMKSFDAFLAMEKGAGAKQAKAKDDSFWSDRSKGLKMYSGDLPAVTTKQRTEMAASRISSHF